MAFLQTTYTSIAGGGGDSALDKWKSWLTTNGWTDNSSGPAFLHVSKVINGVEVFFNFAAGNTLVDPFDQSVYADVQGIIVNGSLSFDGGQPVMHQPGYTTVAYSAPPGTGDNFGGNLDNMIVGGGDCYFFATATTASAVFEIDSPYSNFVELTIGVTSLGLPYYASSGGSRDNYRDGGTRYAYMSLVDDGVSDYPTGAGAVYDGTGWFTQSKQYGTQTWSLIPQIKASSDNLAGNGSTARFIVDNSPDGFRGNQPMALCAPTVLKATTTAYYPIGTVEGVYFLNVTNYADGSSIVAGGSNYLVFAINRGESVQGVAFLK